MDNIHVLNMIWQQSLGSYSIWRKEVWYWFFMPEGNSLTIKQACSLVVKARFFSNAEVFWWKHAWDSYTSFRCQFLGKEIQLPLNTPITSFQIQRPKPMTPIPTVHSSLTQPLATHARPLDRRYLLLMCRSHQSEEPVQTKQCRRTETPC